MGLFLGSSTSLAVPAIGRDLIKNSMFILIRANGKPVPRSPDNPLRRSQDLFWVLGAAVMTGAIMIILEIQDEIDVCFVTVF